MKVLVIGQGGREHAIVKALSMSMSCGEIHAIPGSHGMAKLAICHDLNWRDTEKLVQFCLKTDVDYVIIGPEDPLVEGVADHLRERGILVVGPSREAAKLEGSKIFAKEFMRESGVPTSSYKIVKSISDVQAVVDQFTPPYVLKADGLAAGKGVFICKNKSELEEAARNIFEKKTLGKAGEQALLEQFMPGWELSFLVLTNGKSWQALPLAQDHKRLRDHDEGPNTGGMGTIAPLNIDRGLRERIEKEIITPTVQLIDQKKMIYRGVLYFGLMITEKGPQVLEFNARFGDPETQVIMPLVDGDWCLALHEIAKGQLPMLRWKNMHSACVVLAAPGYPDKPEKGVLIRGNPDYETTSSYFLHAGTLKTANKEWHTNGGRVINSMGIGSTLAEAVTKAYEQASHVEWMGLQMRHDIGKKLTS